MSSDPTFYIKRVAGFFVGVGVTGILMNATTAECPPRNGLHQAIRFYGRAAVAGAISKVVVDQMNQAIDKAYHK